MTPSDAVWLVVGLFIAALIVAGGLWLFWPEQREDEQPEESRPLEQFDRWDPR